MEPNLSRRGFLRSSSTLSGAAWLKLQSSALVAVTASACTARESSSPFKVLGNVEAADLATISARLIPTTDTPGATEAGVIHFFDQAFAGPMSGQLDNARAGLAEFNQALQKTHPDVTSLTELKPEAQDSFLKTREHGDFFELVRIMTIYGFFAMDSHGGNRGHVSWDAISFKGHHSAWAPPFGHYDAQAAKIQVMTGASDGE